MTSTLTRLELEIVRYIVAGDRNQDIALKLGFTEQTVKNYVSVILKKTQLHSRTGLAVWALRHFELFVSVTPRVTAEY